MHAIIHPNSLTTIVIGEFSIITPKRSIPNAHQHTISTQKDKVDLSKGNEK
jgi:hypothetical protein